VEFEFHKTSHSELAAKLCTFLPPGPHAPEAVLSHIPEATSSLAFYLPLSSNGELTTAVTLLSSSVHLLSS
jgi:hypothetical protein